MSPGEIVVDGSSIRGNSALFDGTTVNSGDTNSNLKFTDGTNAFLRPGSTIKVYRNHAVLESGVAILHGVGRHELIADGLRVSSPMQDAVVLVGVNDGQHFEVMAKVGEIEIHTPSGNLVARIAVGNTRNFAIGAPDQNPSVVKLQGILRQNQAGNYLLSDPQAGVTYELRGSGLQDLVGSSVAVTGTVQAGSAAPGTFQVVQITEIHPLGVVRSTNPTPTAGAPAMSGPILGANTIILGVAVGAGGALIGLAAAGTFTADPTPASPVTP